MVSLHSEKNFTVINHIVVAVGLCPQHFCGDNGGAFFGFKSFNTSPHLLVDKINHSLEGDGRKPIRDQYSIKIENLGDVNIVFILGSQSMISCFPVLNSQSQMSFESKVINEWVHVDSVEAQISGKGKEMIGLNFFATDYLENKQLYQSTPKLEISFSAFAYVMKKSDKLPDNFSDEFVAFMPNTEGNDPTLYDFFGKVIFFRQYECEGIRGFIVKTKLINHEKDEDFFVIDMFINEENLRVDTLKNGMRISGCFWLQGKIVGDNTIE